MNVNGLSSRTAKSRMSRPETHSTGIPLSICTLARPRPQRRRQSDISHHGATSEGKKSRATALRHQSDRLDVRFRLRPILLDIVPSSAFHRHERLTTLVNGVDPEHDARGVKLVASV